MAAFEVSFDKSSGKVSYKNNKTNIVQFRTEAALSTKDTKAPQLQGKKWLEEEEWGEYDGWEEEDDGVGWRKWPENPYGPKYVYNIPEPKEPPQHQFPLPEDIVHVATRLPEEWECRFDRITGRVYYVNVRTKISSWEPPPLVPPHQAQAEKAEAVIAEISKLQAKNHAAALKVARLQRRLRAAPAQRYLMYQEPLTLTAPPSSMSLVLFDPSAGAPASPEPPKKKAKKPKTERVVLPWDFEQFKSFVEDANITPEGTFERFCRRQLRELPGVQLEDCKAHWLVLPPREQKNLISEQKWVLEGARKIFDNRMRAIGIKAPEALEERWKSLEWRERQDYLEDAEYKVDADSKKK